MMRDRIRRTKTGEMLLDVAKYFATISGVGGVLAGTLNWKFSVLGVTMATMTWVAAYFTIPQDTEDK